jgi:hypothetical protein
MQLAVIAGIQLPRQLPALQAALGIAAGFAYAGR